MTKRKPFLSLYFLISLVVIVVAVVLSLTVGLRVGSDIGGGTQFEVKIEQSANVKEQTSLIKSALRSKGLTAEKIFVEDKGTERAIVVRVAQKDIKSDVREAVANKLQVSLENVSEFSNINGLITKKVILWTSVAIIGVLLLIFVAGWLRYKLMAGLSLTFSMLHALLLSVAALVVTRIPLTFASLVIILCGLALVLFASILTLERLRENAKLKHNEGMSAYELVGASKKSTLKPLLFLLAMLLVLDIVVLCTPVLYVTMSALTILVVLVCSAYSYYFVGMEMHASLLDLKMTRDKLKLSKNPEDNAPKQKSIKKEKTKQEKPKTDKQKDKEMKAKMKARKDKEKSKDTSAPVV